jgi:hypothetical protein
MAPTLRVLTTVCNSPDYIRLQLRGFQRWLHVPFEFIVFNDAKSWPDQTNFGDAGMRGRIEETCRELGIRCIAVENGHHRYEQSASKRHTDTLRAVMEFVRREPGRYWMIDSDMFLVDDMGSEDVEAALAGAGSYVRQIRRTDQGGQEIEYCWPNLWWVDTALTNTEGLSWDLAPFCDTGGASAPWLTKHKEAVHWIKHLQSCTWTAKQLPPRLVWLRAFLEADTDRNRDGQFWCEIYDGNILHLRAGSNWNGEGAAVHTALLERCKQLMNMVRQ